MAFPRRRFLFAPALAATWPAAFAQGPAWPAKPVRLVVPFTPGGPTDTIARMVSQKMQEVWKQPVLIEYKPGAGTVLGTDFVAKSAPDGHTLGMAISALFLNPSLQPGLPYDTLRDIAGVTQLAQAHFALFAHPSFPASTVPEVIAWAKKNPGALSYATPGTGTGTHLAGEFMKSLGGFGMVHVPYKGSAPAQQDVIGGRVPLLFDVMYSAMPFVRQGRLKIIAVASPKRAATEPQVPMIAETLPGFGAMSVIGLIAPAATPREILRRAGESVGRAVRESELTDRMAQLGMEPVGSMPEEYDALIRSEMDKWARVIKAGNIKAE
jgi:tripartite-type tricarboxylate transporter receptor subunit TctC